MKMEEAKRIADRYLDNINKCVEFEDAYIFMNEGSMCSIGGPEEPVVILKADGKAVDQTAYYDTIAKNPNVLGEYRF